MRPTSRTTIGIVALALTGMLLGACTAAPAPSPTSEPDLELRVGTALPVTGSMSFAGPATIAGTEYAAADINAADKGIKLRLIQGDSGDIDNDAYLTEIPRLLKAGVSAIVGAASSGTSLQFIDEVVSAGVVQISPANTSDLFTTYDDLGLYFRTTPPDTAQGSVLGDLIAQDGATRLGIIAIADAYGIGLAGDVTAAFEATGGRIVAADTYQNGETTFAAQIGPVVAAEPEAIAIIGFQEIRRLLPELLATGYPGDRIYFVDGNLLQFGRQGIDLGGAIAGAKGTRPGLPIDMIGRFKDALQTFWTDRGEPPITDFAFAPESYDAVVLLALAALQAGSTDGRAIADQLVPVSGGPGDTGLASSESESATKCTSFAECADIILGGGKADYDGISGPITFDAVGDPRGATVSVYQYGPDGNFASYRP